MKFCWIPEFLVEICGKVEGSRVLCQLVWWNTTFCKYGKGRKVFVRGKGNFVWLQKQIFGFDYELFTPNLTFLGFLHLVLFFLGW